MLDERATNLLHVILSSRLVTMKELEERLDCTRRQVSYDLQKINDWLIDQELPPIENKRSFGLIIDKRVKEHVSTILPNLKTEEYILSHEVRMAIILLSAFMNDEYLSVNHVTNILKVSRNTVLSYVKQADSHASRYGVSLQYNRQAGYHLTGDEMAVRKLALKMLSRIIQQQNGMTLIERMVDECKGKGTFLACFQQMHAALSQMEDSLHVSYVEERMRELAAYFTILLIRINVRRLLFFPKEIVETIQETDGYDAVEQMMKDSQLSVSEDEKIYLTMLVLGLNVRYDLYLYQKPDENDLSKIIDEIISEFEILACVTFIDREHAKQALLMHLKPAYYRMIFNIPITNPYLNKIKEEHLDLFNLVKKSLKKLEEAVGSTISEDEVGYITLHFGSFLTAQGLPFRRKRSIIVCPSGVGTSNLLKREIEQLVPEIEIVKVISIREFNEKIEDEFDLIFSTVMLQTKKPLLVVQPILTALDKAKIIQEVDVVLQGSRPNTPNVHQLIEVIKLFSTVHDEKGLYTAITNVLTGNMAKTIGRYKPVLKELITKEMIQVVDFVESWEEAIRLAANPLLEAHSINGEYVEAMIKNVMEMGAYIVLTPKVALPHARPEEGVKKLGMSLLKLNQPVSFSEGDPDKDVNIIIVLAATDNETHLKALSQLSELLEEDENINEILKASNADSIIPLIYQYS
ncbi:transcriptional antiterminator [Bacillus oleivorans]|uniref:Transcriptional antiterminator n=1 Tax=Bacillus oleivorans TaxID=1448271 RepID=A0A285CJQ9_9BACI|nr:BglG family transcription antiterminator [Bacillus oleivorans]SNX67233.1 transcriptional antiterminator [Bacillus oleivorans]